MASSAERSVSLSENSFTNARGQKLCTRLYLPEKDQVKAVMVRLHGLGDYSGRGHEGDTFFATNGIAVWTFDAHGHGKSEPLEEQGRAAVFKFEHLVEDTELFFDQVLEPWYESVDANYPVFLMGASMGALVATHIAGRKHAHIQGLILTAAAMGVQKNLIMRLQEPFAALFNKFIPRAKMVPALPADVLAKDPEVKKKLDEDPVVYNGNVRICTACSVLEGIAGLPQMKEQITVPVLMLHGEDDKVCPAENARKVFDALPSSDKTFELINEAYHDLEHDYCKDDWRTRLMAWFDKH